MQRLENLLIKMGKDPTEFFSQISDGIIKVLGNGAKKFIAAILVILLMGLAIKLGNKIIDKFFIRKNFGKISIEERRANTLSTILKSVLRYLIYFVGIVTIVGFFMDVTSIIAVAGIGGLAIGFGAQDLVRDVVTGFFIFLEDQFSVGDYITVDSFGGIVESMGLRTTQIRDFNGDLHIIPNGEIAKVTNHSRGNMRAMVDVAISYEEDVQRAIGVLNKLCRKIAEENDTIVDGPHVLGVENLGDFSVNIRIIAKTLNMEQWAVERLLRKEIKEALEQEGIKIPYLPRSFIKKD